ncbi:MAG: hypothetical protein ACP5HJ_02955 [Candidatus Micrarchaeia archaeon]
MINEKNGREVKCNRCGYVWIYKGNNPYYATCPRCHRLVKIGEVKKEDGSVTNE